MARYGIVARKVYGGWPSPALKKLSREIGRDHALAREARFMLSIHAPPVGLPPTRGANSKARLYGRS